jgi:hypothetical protein
MLDPTSSDACFSYSIKRYFIDHVQHSLGVPVAFDANIVEPYLNDKAIVRWITVLKGDKRVKKFSLSDSMVSIYCCTRQDPEGYELSKLQDEIVALLNGEHDTIVTPKNTIPIYDVNHVKVGGLSLGDDLIEGKKGVTPDGTNYKTITIHLRYASK